MRFPGGKLLQQLLLAKDHRRMHQGIQTRQAFRRTEDPGSQGTTVDFAVIPQDVIAKFLHHSLVRLPALSQNFVAQFIGLNQETSEAHQRFAHESLPAGKAACQPGLYHRPASRSAEATVFAINMAMVKGPTPPGTGVYALAFSTTSSGSTSPTRRLPLLSKDASFSGEFRKMRAASARSSIRLVPTSITVTPLARKSAVSMAARPMAATRISDIGRA